MPISGAHALLQLLRDAGVRRIFGNPGTTELPLLDALAADDRFEYVLGLQEVPVMAMADGFSQASRTLGVVNLHICCGLGNAMGMLYNAWCAGTPLLVTAGQQDRRLSFGEPVLWGPMVDVARPWTKWAVEVNRVQDVPSAIRRAIQTALTPPSGPVFLSLPIDVQMEQAELDLTPAATLDTRVRPPRQAIEQAATLLVAAKNPVILAGSRVTEAGAFSELVAVAESLGAPVLGEGDTSHGRMAFPCDHPLWADPLPLWSPQFRERLKDFDVALVVGMNLLREYIHMEPARALPESLKLVQFDNREREIGKNFPVQVGVLGHIKTALGELVELLRSTMSPRQREAAQSRAGSLAAQRSKQQAELRQKIESQRAIRPLTPLCFMESLAHALPDDVAVVESAVTTTGGTLAKLGAIKDPSGYFGHRGWALGWGLGCAIGVKLAWPRRPVLAILGEGDAMYGIQGLWTAAHYNIPVTFVIANNAQYGILKACGKLLNLPQARAGNFLGHDLVGPEIDFVALSQALGVAAQRVGEPEELSQAVRDSLQGAAPRLIEVPLVREPAGSEAVKK